MWPLPHFVNYGTFQSNRQIGNKLNAVKILKYNDNDDLNMNDLVKSAIKF